MLKPSSFVAIFLLAVAIAPACSTAPSAPTGPSSAGSSTNLTTAEIVGTWTVTSMQPAGQPEQAAPASAVYSVTFDGDRVSSKVDCNRCNGAMRLDGNALTLGPNMACTKAACSTMAYENSFLSVLSGESQIASQGSTLTLTSPRGVVRLRR